MQNSEEEYEVEMQCNGKTVKIRGLMRNGKPYGSTAYHCYDGQIWHMQNVDCELLRKFAGTALHLFEGLD